MFYEVKVLDAKGNVKKVISPKVLSARFWKSHFGDNQNGNGSGKGSVGPSEIGFGHELGLSDSAGNFEADSEAFE